MSRLKIKKRESKDVFLELTKENERLREQVKNLSFVIKRLNADNGTISNTLQEFKDLLNKANAEKNARKKENTILRAESSYTDEGHVRAVCQCEACRGDRNRSTRILLARNVKQHGEGLPSEITETWKSVYFTEEEKEDPIQLDDDIPF